ncbi:MAG: hypothetical protein U0235_16325 [Polyangiaceae bacterium]
MRFWSQVVMFFSLAIAIAACGASGDNTPGTTARVDASTSDPDFVDTSKTSCKPKTCAELGRLRQERRRVRRPDRLRLLQVAQVLRRGRLQQVRR